MRNRHFHFVFAALFAFTATANAGLYYTGEVYADLPSQWRGYLLDQNMLRRIAVKPTALVDASPARNRYLDAAEMLEKKRKTGKATAGELADLGAVYVRLGEIDKAVDLLRNAQRDHPNHFRTVANLGTAWQLKGDLQQAALNLQQAFRLAPDKYRQAEKYHLKLIRERLKEKETGGLDNLFDVRFVGKNGEYEAGKIAEAERKKLPANAVVVTQQLALWLPADPRLLWQLAELANAYGDVRVAANMMDGCVTQFNFQPKELREHRRILRTAVAKMPKITIGSKAQHKKHVGGLLAKSKRPLMTKIDVSQLPEIVEGEYNRLPWEVLAETELDRTKKFQPQFHQYLKQLEGKMVTLTGFMQPLRDELEVSAFMFIEYPVGCWYCEMPDLIGIVWVEMPVGKTANFERGFIRVNGRLRLNNNDPENFLYTLEDAKVGGVD